MTSYTAHLKGLADGQYNIKCCLLNSGGGGRRVCEVGGALNQLEACMCSKEGLAGTDTHGSENTGHH